jgi:lipopolysaccharide export system permease protein
VIYLNERDGSKLKDFWIWEMDESNRVEMFIRSKTGELSYDQNTNALTLNLNNGSIERRSEALNKTIQVDSPKILFFENLPISLPLNDIFGRSENQILRFKHMTFAQLMEERERIIEKDRASKVRFSDERANIQNYIHKNFSQAYSVFALAIIGIPLAIKVGRKESYVNVFLALAVAFGYHFLFILVSWFDEIPGLRSDLILWVPNILFQSLGFWLFAKSANQ